MLRLATDSDLDAMRRWRNHPEVRRVSLTQHEITADEHAAWWAGTKRDDTRAVLIYERDETPSGVVNLFDIDREAGTAWWGYFLDNKGLEERGGLMPAWISIQREAAKYVRDEMGLREMHGETLAENASVRESNARQKFDEVDTCQRDINGVSVTVVHTRRVFEEK